MVAIDLCHDQPFEALCDNGYQSHRIIVIKTRCLAFLWYRDDGRLLVAERDLRLVSREFKDVYEYPRQLVRAGSECSYKTPVTSTLFLYLNFYLL